MGYGTTPWGSGPWGAEDLFGETMTDQLGPFLKVTESSDALRISPVGWTPVDGSFVLVLGSDTPGRFFDFVNGDSIEVSQSGSFETDRILTLITHIRGPDSMPSGARWIAEILIDARVYAQRELLPGREKDLFDMAANVSRFVGDHTLSFRLRFEADVADTFEVELPAWYLDGLTFSDPGENFLSRAAFFAELAAPVVGGVIHHLGDSRDKNFDTYVGHLSALWVTAIVPIFAAEADGAWATHANTAVPQDGTPGWVAPANSKLTSAPYYWGFCSSVATRETGTDVQAGDDIAGLTFAADTQNQAFAPEMWARYVGKDVVVRGLCYRASDEAPIDDILLTWVPSGSADLSLSDPDCVSRAYGYAALAADEHHVVEIELTGKDWSAITSPSIRMCYQPGAGTISGRTFTALHPYYDVIGPGWVSVQYARNGAQISHYTNATYLDLEEALVNLHGAFNSRRNGHCVVHFALAANMAPENWRAQFDVAYTMIRALQPNAMVLISTQYQRYDTPGGDAFGDGHQEPQYRAAYELRGEGVYLLDVSAAIADGSKLSADGVLGDGVHLSDLGVYRDGYAAALAGGGINAAFGNDFVDPNKDNFAQLQQGVEYSMTGLFLDGGESLAPSDVVVAIGGVQVAGSVVPDSDPWKWNLAFTPTGVMSGPDRPVTLTYKGTLRSTRIANVVGLLKFLGDWSDPEGVTVTYSGKKEDPYYTFTATASPYRVYDNAAGPVSATPVTTYITVKHVSGAYNMQMRAGNSGAYSTLRIDGGAISVTDSGVSDGYYLADDGISWVKSGLPPFVDTKGVRVKIITSVTTGQWLIDSVSNACVWQIRDFYVET